jgi:hypothetical protein
MGHRPEILTIIASVLMGYRLLLYLDHMGRVTLVIFSSP